MTRAIPISAAREKIGTLDPWTLANPLLALPLATPWRGPHDVSLLDAVRRARPADADDTVEERIS